MTDERSSTVRQALARALTGEPLTARELSERVGVAEREVAGHLAHIERSLAGSGDALETLPARCVVCGFRFESRERKSRPSRCPECKSERLEPPRFVIRKRGSRR